MRKNLINYINEGKFEQAHTLLEKIISSPNAKNTDFLDFAFVKLKMNKGHNEIFSYAHKAIQAESNILAIFKNIVYILDEINQRKYLLNIIRQVAPQLPIFAIENNLICVKIFTKYECCEEAISILKKLYERNPDNSQILEKLIVLYSEEKEWKEVVFYLEEQFKIEGMKEKERVVWNYVLALFHVCAHTETLSCAEAARKKFKISDPEKLALFPKIYIHCGLLDKADKFLSTLPKEILNHEAIISARGDILWERKYFDSLSELLDKEKEKDDKYHFSRFGISYRKGDIQDAYQHYKIWRAKTQEGLSVRNLTKRKKWNGESLSGKSLFIQTEQGIGDMIHCLRYIDYLKDAEKITVFCRPNGEQEIFKASSFVEDSRINMVESIDNLNFSYHTSFMQLPIILDIDMKRCSAPKTYLKDIFPKERTAWQKVFSPYAQKLKVALVWKGNLKNGVDWKRSLHKQEIFSLVKQCQKNSKIKIFNFQLGINEQEGEKIQEYDIVDVSDKLKSYHDTISALQEIDIVVSADSSMIHIAGALGKKALLFVPFVREWRWYPEELENSLLYPSVKIFPQETHSDWEPVMKKIAAHLINQVSSLTKS